MLNNPPAKTTTTSISDNQSLTTPLTAETHTTPKVLPTPSNVPLARDPTSQECVAPTPLQSNIANEKEDPTPNSTLDCKIDNFLQGNTGLKGFNLGFPSVLPWPKATVDSPSASAENLGGTPVRDEAGATPTQDEIMDVPQTEPFPYQQGQTAPTAIDAKSTHQLPSWQVQNTHTDPQAHTEIHQKSEPIKDFRTSVLSLAEAEAKRHQHIEAVHSSMSSNQQPLRDSVEAPERSGVMHQELRQNPVIHDVGPNSNLVEGIYTYRDNQEKQVLASSDTYNAGTYLPKNPGQDHAAPNFFTTPLPPIPNLPPPPQDFMPPASSLRASGPCATRNLQEHFGEAERGGGDSSCAPANFNYEHLSHEVPNKEPFHPHGDGASHSAHAPHHAPNIPPNGPLDYNHQHPQRVPLQNPPGMPHHRIGSSPPVRGFHEAPSPSQPLPEDPYFEPYYDHPPHSPSPPHYDMHPISPHAPEYYPEEMPPHYPERRVPPHLEHRPLPPHHIRPPHPGHYPPPRPLRRPPPVHHELPFPRGKRPGPPFGGPPRVRGPFYPPKRPYLPPHY